MKIDDYGVSKYGNPHNFYIGDVHKVLEGLLKLEDDIVYGAYWYDDSSYINGQLNIPGCNGAYIDKICVRENGIMIRVMNSFPHMNNKGEDFTNTRLYLFCDGEVHYLIDSVDDRGWDSYTVDKEAIAKLDKRLGNLVESYDGSMKSILFPKAYKAALQKRKDGREKLVRYLFDKVRQSIELKEDGRGRKQYIIMKYYFCIVFY